MDKNFYRKSEFDKIKERLNKEILRRRAYKWWDPLQYPEVGSDQDPVSGKYIPAQSLPVVSGRPREAVTPKSYTINNPSTGAMTSSTPSTINMPQTQPNQNKTGPTRNSPSNPRYTKNHGDNPANSLYDSSANFDFDEIRNFLHGLSKIEDIDLFYGIDEIDKIAFRDPKDIENKLTMAENDIKTQPRNIAGTIQDPNKGKTNANNSGTKGNVPYPVVLPSGETDGDEGFSKEFKSGNLGPNNFFDDYVGKPKNTNYRSSRSSIEFGADGGTKGVPNYPVNGIQTPGNPNYRPTNPNSIPKADDNVYQLQLDSKGNYSFYEDNPDKAPYKYDGKVNSQVIETNKPRPIEYVTSSSKFGQNPRNPSHGASGNNSATTLRRTTSKLDKEFRPRQSYEGGHTTCWEACTGLCFLTCYDACSESCDRICWSRCGEACTASCGQNCSGCTGMCNTGCMTKCQNAVGHSCQYNGSTTKTPIPSRGNETPSNKATYYYATCGGSCQWTCEFYPNYKTECWDTVCMTVCVTSCSDTCLNSCFNGCINNPDQSGRNAQSSKPASGCMYNCTHDCAGSCREDACMSDCTSCTGRCSEDCSSYCAEGECNSSCDSYCNGSCEDDCDHSCGANGDSDAGGGSGGNEDDEF